ncbi:MAG: TonB-dependent receptor [Pseudomonadota bacterium]
MEGFVNSRDRAGMARQRRAALMLGASSMVVASFASVAAAQDDDDGDVIVVSGIRASLEKSADLKRDANGILDTITAQDIGRFPNTNLAESLQRIPGVAINRVNGEGSEVTVRGFGSEFNLVTLNGRTMPTANVQFVGSDETNTSGSSRSFDFQNLAAEGVQALEVYKSGRAGIASGGLGATVNVRTNRPLDNPGFRGSIGAKALVDTSVGDDGDDVTPEISGIVSWTDDQARFGISVFGSYQERDSGAASSSVASWNIFTVDEFLDPDSGLVTGSTNISNAPTDPSALVAIPRDSRYFFSDISRERFNGQVVLQFQPTETLRLTTDYTYAQNQEEEVRAEVSNWFNRPFTDVTFDGNQAIGSAIFLQESLNPVKDYAVTSVLRETEEELESFGFNAEWDVAENITVILDAHTSEATSSPDAPDGQSQFAVGLAAPVVTQHSVSFNSNDIPFQQVLFDDSFNSNGDGVLDLQDVSSTVANLTSVDQTNEVDEIDLRGVWEIDDRSTLMVGFNYRSVENTTNGATSRQILGDWAATQPGDAVGAAPDAIDVFCTTCQFDSFRAPTNGALGFGVRADAAALYGALSPLYESQGNAPFSTGSSSNTVEEDILSFFAEFTTEFEIGGRPARLNTGLRYEDTDVTSSADINAPTAFVWQSDNDFTVQAGSDVTAFSIDGGYDNFLPNVDLSVELREGLVFRTSYSKTIARTSFGNLFASDAVGGLPGPTALGNVATGSRGNASLLPLESDNYDVSVEYYFGESSYFSVGYFEKVVKNFVGVGQSTGNLFGLTDASSGLSGTRSGDALDELNALGAVINDENLFVMTALINDLGSVSAASAEFQANSTGGLVDAAYLGTVNAQFDLVGNADDPLFDFEVTQPINDREATINGIEVAGQHFFGDTGFGVFGSYTYVDGDVGFDDAADPTEDQFALVGLSDTANVTLIYEKYGISASLAYNWRDEFLASTNRGTGFRNPTYVEAFDQLDIAISYDVTDNIVVSFEGINLTGENLRTFGRSETQLWFAQELEPRYLFGARYRF